MRLRINSAKDNAAGQAIANRFTANIKGLTQAARNANDGISIAQTTEGSLNEINNNLQRIRELSVQAANGSNSQTDLDSIQAEIRERLDEIDRVSRDTQFNGKYVLGDDASRLSIQVGAHDNQRIDIELSRIDSSTLGLGSYNVNSLSAGDPSESLSKVTTQTSTDVNIGANTANPNPIGPVMEADGVYKATLTTEAAITPAVEFQGAAAALAAAEAIDADIDPTADAKIVSYDDGAGNTLYAAVDDPTNITKAAQVTMNHTGF